MKCEDKVADYCAQAVKYKKYAEIRRCEKCCLECVDICPHLCEKALDRGRDRW